jgi:hypothetical protein
MVYDNLIGGYLYLCRDKNGNIHIHKVKPLLHLADNPDQEEYFYFSPHFENSLDSPAEVKLADYRFDWYIRVRRNGLFRRHAIVCVPSKIEERQGLIDETKILAFDNENDILKVKVSHLGYASIRLSEFFSIKRHETVWPYLLFAITQSQKSDLRERENLQKSAAAINRQRESDCIHFVIPAIIQLNNRHSGPNALARDVREILEVKLAQDFKADVFAKIIESFRMTVIEKESLSGDDKVKMLGEADALAKRVQALR